MSAAIDRWMLCAIRDGVPSFALFGSPENARSFERLTDGGAIDRFELTDAGRDLLRKLNEPTTPQKREPEGAVAAIDAVRRAARGGDRR
jgi:hypothetical protein